MTAAVVGAGVEGAGVTKVVGVGEEGSRGVGVVGVGVSRVKLGEGSRVVVVGVVAEAVGAGGAGAVDHNAGPLLVQAASGVKTVALDFRM
jgi:hypothetical protein